MCQKFTCFKIVVKNLVGGWVAWVLAHGASEERKLLAQEEIVLVLDEWTGVFSSPETGVFLPPGWDVSLLHGYFQH